MNALAEPLDRYRRLLNTAAASLPGRELDWLSRRRALAIKQFMERGLPSPRDEAWRYTRLDRLTDQDWSLPQPAPSGPSERAIAELILDPAPAARLVFVNGRWDAALSDTPRLDEGMRIASLHQMLEEEPGLIAPWLGLATDANPSTFTALNTALINDGLYLHIPAGAQPSGPIEILYLSTGQHAAPHAAPVVNLRNLIVLGDGASATLVEHYAELGDTSARFTHSLTEVILGAQARLEHARLQDEGPETRHLSQVHIRQGEASHYQGLGISLGGLWSRSEYHNRLTQTRARCELDGLYLAGDRQLTDVHLDITHAVAASSSREHFKGILSGRGRAVFDGRIRVEVDAQQTDAHLVNQNLLLSRDAEIDTKPQLEIYADDVKCSHGTTVGQLDPAQLFYLRARGIDAEAARRLLCLGFALEVMERCSVPGLRARVEQRLDQKLAQVPPTETLQTQ
ncbi:MAG: Fe-S cluster assembly protein SufD [Gammaproteobacteria bacterium]